MLKGYARVSAAIPRCVVADTQANVESLLALWQDAHSAHCSLVVFPELAVSAYTVRDLFHDQGLLERCERALLHLAAESRALAPMAIVGCPLRVGHGIFNVAVAIQDGQILAAVPKAYLPNYREFEETRWFRPGVEVDAGTVARIGDQQVPFGLDILLQAKNDRNLVVGIEICEDYWVHIPPSSHQFSAGATLAVNLSASNFVIGKAELRRLLAQAHSDRGKAAYIYVAAGPGESSTDLAFDADAFVCENGTILTESTRFARNNQLIVADIDLETLSRERYTTNSFGDCSRENPATFRTVEFTAVQSGVGLHRTVEAHPFLPTDETTLSRRCWEVFEIQSNALATRMKAMGTPKLILGVSGGLDSTQAALVAAQALKLTGQSPDDLVCVTMPGLGTTDSTKNNAKALSEALCATFKTIGIGALSQAVLAALNHPSVDGVDSMDALILRLRSQPEFADVTVENVQARLRTLMLMNLANQLGGLVVGTGDLSEKALGWSTYAGDHIAMYDVNAGIPKTLIRFVIRWVANERARHWADTEAKALRTTLFGILDTPISPELLPTDEDGRIAQLTESTIGPFELHDFFLYHFVRRGSRPGRMLDLASIAFEGRYAPDVLQGWLKVFLRRFFTHQFKRSCTADAPKVGMVSLSPRGDWRMPSDAKVDAWLEEVDAWTPHG
ncbi:MAG: NAD(+) synthase [Myxococcota bacterium]|nr:NAD(+) synthase [Myxococcota bacterium]